MAQADPVVLVLSLGGTIAMSAAPGDVARPQLSGADLVAAVPQLSGLATVEAESFRQLPGAHLTSDDVAALADRIDAEVARGVRGVVVTQGTDTLEETSFLLDLLLDVDVPVVMTGAMRNPSLPGADGPANLLAAVQVALSEPARGLGVLVVMNDEIHAARFVAKRHSTSPAAFVSAPGPVGWVTEGAPRVVVRPDRWVKVDRPRGPRPRVLLYTVSIDDDGSTLDALSRGPLDGLVVEAFGGGHLPPVLLEPLGELAARIPVVYASRTGSGETLRRTYGFAGSETDLLARGLVSAGRLDGPKARILLSALLRSGLDAAAARARFEESVAA